MNGPIPEIWLRLLRSGPLSRGPIEQEETEVGSLTPAGCSRQLQKQDQEHKDGNKHQLLRL